MNGLTSSSDLGLCAFNAAASGFGAPPNIDTAPGGNYKRQDKMLFLRCILKGDLNDVHKTVTCKLQ